MSAEAPVLVTADFQRATLLAMAQETHPMHARLCAESRWVDRLYHRRLCAFVIAEHDRRGDYHGWEETFVACSELLTFLFGPPHCREERPRPDDAQIARRLLARWRDFDVLEHLMAASRGTMLPAGTYMPAFLTVWRDFVAFLGAEGLIPAREVRRLLRQYDLVSSLALDTWSDGDLELAQDREPSTGTRQRWRRGG